MTDILSIPGTADLHRRCRSLSHDFQSIWLTVSFLVRVAVIADRRAVVILVKAELLQLGKRHALALSASAARTYLADDAGIAADRVAVDRMVDRAVADAGFLHRADDRLERLQILRRVTVQLDVADVAAVGERVVGRLQGDLVVGGDIEVHRHMEAVGVVVADGHARDNAVAGAVDANEAAGKAFGRRGDERVVHATLLRHAVAVGTHVADDLQTQALGLGRLAVMLTGQRHQALGQTDEARGQRAVLQHLALLVGGREFLGIDPNALAHEERRVVHVLASLNLEALIQLTGHQLQLGVEQVEEQVDVALGANGQTRQVDGREGQVAAAGRHLAIGIVHVAHDAGAAAHIGNLGFRMTLLVVLEVKRCIQEGKVWELYDIGKDRVEACDLSAVHPDILKQLSDKWAVWAAETKVLIPFPNNKK